MRLTITENNKILFATDVADADLMLSLSSKKTRPVPSAVERVDQVPKQLSLYAEDDDRDIPSTYQPPPYFDVPPDLKYLDLVEFVCQMPHVFRGGLDDPRNLPVNSDFVFHLPEVPPFRVRYQMLAYEVGSTKYATLGEVFDEHVHPFYKKVGSKGRRSAYEWLAEATDLSDWRPSLPLRDEYELSRFVTVNGGWSYNKRILHLGRGKTSTPLVTYYKLDPEELFLGVIVHYRTPAVLEMRQGLLRSQTPDTWYYYQMARNDVRLSMPRPGTVHPKPWTARSLDRLLDRANRYFNGCREIAGGSKTRKKQNHDAQMALPIDKEDKPNEHS
jgi:hypothetical protein